MRSKHKSMAAGSFTSVSVGRNGSSKVGVSPKLASKRTSAHFVMRNSEHRGATTLALPTLSFPHLPSECRDCVISLEVLLFFFLVFFFYPCLSSSPHPYCLGARVFSPYSAFNFSISRFGKSSGRTLNPRHRTEP
ncbi:hypothetical protein BDV32DRAFT_8038 [Aspergillus pseudonomiae]|nr:hypothetical protein BDV32DRAFT_8038 [Aspergillus pseudonomiae]